MYEIRESNVRGELVLEATFSGEIDRNIFFQFIDIMAVYEDIYPKHKLLVDFTEVSNVSINYKDLKSIVQYVKEYDKRQGNAAFVTGPDISKYMLAKLFVDLVSLFRPNQKNAFRCLEKATNWLCPNNA